MDTPELSENPYASPGRNASPFLPATDDADVEIIAEGVAEESEMLRAAMLPQRKSLRKVQLFFAVLAAIFAGMGAVSWHQGGKAPIPALILAGVMLAFPQSFYSLIRRTLRQFYRQSALAKEPTRRRITADVVEMMTPTVHSAMRWEALNGYFEADEAVMIRSAHNAGIFYPFYRGHFTPPDWEQFRNLVRSKLKKL